MTRPTTLLWLALSLWLCAALPALALCAGTDLRDGLSGDETAALADRLDGAPFAEGNHWRATKDDEVLHLIGTVHVTDARLDPVARRLAPLISEASLLLLEMTAAEQAQLAAAMATRPELLVMPDASLPDLMPEADWQALAAALRARGMPPFMAARFQPWYVATLLALPPCLADGLTEQNGLDARLQRLAGAAGVPTRALEPFDTGFSVMADLELAMQIDMIRASLTSPEAGEDLFETLIEGYFDERHLESWVLSEILAPRYSPLDAAVNATIFAAVEERLLIRRNAAWLPVLTAALEETEGMVVAAFGAAHLGGRHGVLQRLAEAGFTLERLAF